MDGRIVGDLFRNAWFMEEWNHQGATMSVDIPMPGVDPLSIRVSRIGNDRVSVHWLARDGSAPHRAWTTERFTDVAAVHKNGMLTIMISLIPPAPPKAPSPEVPVNVRVL